MDANWSPDGKSLLFGSLHIRNGPIYTIDLMTKRVSPFARFKWFFFSPLVAGWQKHVRPSQRHIAR